MWGPPPLTSQPLWHRAACVQVTTFGKQGAVLLRRVDAEPSAGDSQTLQAVLDSMFEELTALPQPVRGTDTAAVTTESGVTVFPGHVVRTEQPVTLQFDRCSPPHACMHPRVGIRSLGATPLCGAPARSPLHGCRALSLQPLPCEAAKAASLHMGQSLLQV